MRVVNLRVGLSGCPALLFALASGCGGGGSGSANPPPPTPSSTITSITVSPSAAIIGTQQQFAAAVSGTGNFSNSVTWSISCPACSGHSPGTLSPSGLYTTPYPAPASVVITATSEQDPTKSGSATVALNPPPVAKGPGLTVEVGNPTHPINPLIYGMNGYLLDAASAKIAHPSIIRWGGDDTSRYNYQNNSTNSAADYYFESFTGAAFMFGGGSFTGFLTADNGIGAISLGTVPVLGWVTNGAVGACSFSRASYPNQQSFNSDNCGDGIYPDGANGCSNKDGCAIYGNSTIAAITSIPEAPPDITAQTTPPPGAVTTAWAGGTWSGAWVGSLVNNLSYGPASGGKGVNVWDLDNEPTWWDAVHRDVHPAPFTYDEVTNNGLGTALAIKTADPSAAVSGPVIDYWWTYFYSKKDIENGWSTGPCYEPWQNPTDRQAHGGVPMIEYYLQQFAKYSQSYGFRLLDYVSIHGYFAPDYNGASVGFTAAGDTAEQQVRLNGTRAFWDPTYTDPNYPQPNYVTDANYTSNCSTPLKAPQLIPMLEAWVQKDYPGTKTSIDEYNFGGLESINGALVQADLLGIFGRQGLDMAAFWPTDDYNKQVPGNYAFAVYRNYDGNDSLFGDIALASTSATSSNTDGEGQLAVYGALRSSDKAVTTIVINKTYGDLTSTISLANFTSSSATASAYRYSSANLNAIVALPAVTVTPPNTGSTTSTVSMTFPAQSITLLVVPN